MLSELEFEDFKAQEFDSVLDVRSPREFKEAHLSGALNFYALSDEEHQEIGTLYKKSPSLAKTKGAAFICANVARRLEDLTQRVRIGAKIGVYCARGGLRSRAVGVILSELGYRVVRLRGGFKAYRAFVNAYFAAPLGLKFFVLCGNTGCGKTELLSLLSRAIDLEAMAGHLGSSFGDILGEQPSQKAFEEALFFRLQALKEWAFIESESPKIGRISLPKRLYEAMQGGVKILCVASLQERIARIKRLYKDRMDATRFGLCLGRISPYISRNLRLDLQKSYEQGEWERLIAMLLSYYDGSYKKPARVDKVLNTDDIGRAREELLEFCILKSFH